MENWEDTGVVLSARPYGDNAAIVSLLTEQHGRHSGYVHGGQSSKLRGVLQSGNIVSVEWSSRIEDSLGQYNIELERSSVAGVLNNRLGLQALQSACAIADRVLSERESCPAVTAGMQAFLDTLYMDNDVWFPAYIYWELGLLRELGFGLDLTCCAVSGETENLAYVSPKTGRAATNKAGEEYRDKLLVLPSFLCGGKGWSDGDILDGLKLTGHFLRHRVFAQTHMDLPEARLMLEQLLTDSIDSLAG